MTPRNYREAWAWVHLFLNGSSPEKAVLLASLAELNSGHNKPRFEEKGANNERLLAHIKALQSRSLATKTPPAESTIRLQDKVADVPVIMPAERGLWRRLRTWIGF